jgi:hypothetical protein
MVAGTEVPEAKIYDSLGYTDLKMRDWSTGGPYYQHIRHAMLSVFVYYRRT